MNPPKLTFISGVSQGTVFEIDRPVVRLGRSSRNNLRIRDDEASRVHCEIRGNNSSYYIIDLDSANGTFVNGEPIQWADLRSGDEIRIGKTHLRFSHVRRLSDSSDELSLQISRDSSEPEVVVSRAGDQERGTQVAESKDSASKPSSWPKPPQVRASAQANFQTLANVMHAIRQAADEKTLLQEVLSRVVQLTNADRGAILLHCSVTKGLLPGATWLNPQSSDLSPRLKVSETIVRHVLTSQQSVLISDARDDERFRHSESMIGTGVLDAICCPLRGRYDVIGLLYVDTQVNEHSNCSSRPNARFDQSLLEMVNTVAEHAALALEVSRYYNALINSERMAAVGQITAIMSHNIKNVMQGYKSGEYLIESAIGKQDWTQLKRGWGLVRSSQEDILHLFNNVLSYSRVRDPILIPLKIQELFERLKAATSDVAKPQRVALSFELESEGLELICDPNGIYHALLNLVLNAIEACHRRPQAVVRLVARMLEDPQVIELVVEDNGHGIPVELKGRLFQEFFTSKGHKGTGLGLMSVKKTVEEHQGEISFDSEFEVGTRFVIKLPQPRAAPQ